ncbi:MAG: tail fiber protein [Elusimicrobia bacterium]|nr:tail fiber protein [Elusimicrobiota bacterium]
MKKQWFLFGIMLCMLFGISYLYAEVPNEIVYQGKLKEYGLPFNGSKNMVFEIYPAASGEIASWSSGTQSITVSSGIFSYTMSPNIDWRAKDYWIQLKVNSKDLSPREKITAQAYALHSATAENMKANSNINFMINGSTIATLTSEGYFLINGQNVVPVGSIIPYAGDTAPAGWLLCNGDPVSRTTYANLYAVIQEKFGQGDGSSTFNLPDLRGRFLRGRDAGAGRDPDSASRTAMNTGGNTGDAVGSMQTDEFKSHNHSISIMQPGAAYSNVSMGSSSSVGPLSTSSAGGNETRPINAYVNYIVKY